MFQYLMCIPICMYIYINEINNHLMQIICKCEWICQKKKIDIIHMYRLNTSMLNIFTSDAFHRVWACPGHASERTRAMCVWEGDWSMLPLTFRVTGLPTMLTLTAFGARAFECILAWQRFLLEVANKTWVSAVRRVPLLPPWRAVVVGDVAQYGAFGVD